MPDPYRWLEDDNSPDTAAWVAADNTVTFGYLEQIPYRGALKARLEALYNYPKYGAPSRKGANFFFSKNDGLQNQSVLYVQKGLTGTPEVLIDPNKWSEDGTTRLGAFSQSRNGKYAVVGVSRAGSDWQEYGVMEVATKTMLPDKLEWIKMSRAAWRGDGFFYSCVWARRGRPRRLIAGVTLTRERQASGDRSNASSSEVSFHCRSHLQIILASGLLDQPVAVPWWAGRRLRLTTYNGPAEPAPA